MNGGSAHSSDGQGRRWLSSCSSISGKLWRCPPVFSADSSVLFCSCSRVIKAVSVATGEQLCALRGHTEDVTAMAVHSDQLLSCSLDGTLRVWCMDGNSRTRWKCSRTVKLRRPLVSVMISGEGSDACAVLLGRSSAPLAEGGAVSAVQSQPQAQSDQHQKGRKSKRAGSKPQSKASDAVSAAKRPRKDEPGGGDVDPKSDKNKSKKEKRKKSRTVKSIAVLEAAAASSHPPVHPASEIVEVAWKLLLVKLGGDDDNERVFSSAVCKGKHPLMAAFGVGKLQFAAVPRGPSLVVVGTAVGGPAMGKLWEPNFRALGLSDRKSRKITAVAGCLATGAVATGHEDGTITLWFGLGQAADQVLTLRRSGVDDASDQMVTVATHHWHAHAVECLSFSPDGKFLLSGGEEAVMVQWNLVKGTQSFMARLGGPLSRLSPSPSGVHVALSTKDNCVRLIKLYKFEEQWQLRGLSLTPTFDVANYAKLVRVQLDASSGHLVLNGHPGHLQFYDLDSDLIRQTIEVAAYNRVSRLEYERMSPPIVSGACFSPDGQRMATVDTRVYNKQGARSELSDKGVEGGRELKFWHRNAATRDMVVDTIANDPHDSAIVSILYHPKRNEVVTLASAGDFKVWELKRRLGAVPVPVSRKQGSGATHRNQHQLVQPTETWASVLSVCFRAGVPAYGAALSGDGSILAVSYRGVVALWSARSATLLATLVPPIPTALLSELHFPANGTMLVAAGPGLAVAWDLLSLQILWSFEGDACCSSIITETMLESTRITGPAAGDGDIAICFQLEGDASVVLLLSSRSRSPEPLCAWRLDSGVPSSLTFSKDGIVALMHKGEMLLLSCEDSPEDTEGEDPAAGKDGIGILHSSKRALATVPSLPVGPVAASTSRAVRDASPPLGFRGVRPLPGRMGASVADDSSIFLNVASQQFESFVAERLAPPQHPSSLSSHAALERPQSHPTARLNDPLGAAVMEPISSISPKPGFGIDQGLLNILQSAAVSRKPARSTGRS